MRIGIVASSVQVQESGGDVTPDAVNWTNISTGGLPSGYYLPAPTISGITSPVTLEITFTAGLGLEYSTNGGSSFSSISSGGTLVFNNGDTITFKMVSGTANVEYTVTIKNVTDGNAILDTFTCKLYSF